jgi:hypothetical protein
MRGLALALVMLLAAGPSRSHFVDPFDRYISAVKATTLQPQLKKYAEECGVDTVAGQPRYALGGKEWLPVKDLPKSVYDLASDYFTTGEFWNAGDRHFVVIWSMDLETEIRLSYCFDGKGTIRFMDSRVWEISRPDNQGWSFERRWKPDASGHLMPQDGQFVGLDGKPIARPKLEDDEQKHIDWQGSASRLSDLKLPESLLQ